MKKCLAFTVLLAFAAGAFGQGSVFFSNRTGLGGTGPQAPVVAPIFGVDPVDPFSQKQGNPSASWNGTSGPTPTPAGSHVYNGTPLNGTGFTAQLWAVNSQSPDSGLQPIASTPFRTTTVESFRGSFQATFAVVPDTPFDPASLAKFQVRAWDNQDGTVTTWDQVLESNVPRGWSTIFTVPFPVGGGPILAPDLIGLESFQLFIPEVVPEPSVIALGVVGAGFVFLIRRRKK